MKRIIIYVFIFVSSLPALAQNNVSFFEQLTNQYSDKEGFSASMITKDMFDLYLKKKNVDRESPAFEAIKNLTKIMVVSQSNLNSTWSTFTRDEKPEKKEKDPPSDELNQKILTHYKNGEYTLLKTEKRMGEEVKVYLKRAQDKIVSLAVLTISSVNTSLVELQGDINLAAVADLNNALNLRGLENLYKINNSSNVVYFGQNNVYIPKGKIEEMAAHQKELLERQQSFSDEQRAKYQEQIGVQEYRQLEMAQKYREMADRYQRRPIFLNYPGDSTIYYLNGKKVNVDEIKELDNSKIKTMEINKAEKEGDKTTIRIKTK